MPGGLRAGHVFVHVIRVVLQDADEVDVERDEEEVLDERLAIAFVLLDHVLFKLALLFGGTVDQVRHERAFWHDFFAGIFLRPFDVFELVRVCQHPLDHLVQIARVSHVVAREADLLFVEAELHQLADH